MFLDVDLHHDGRIGPVGDDGMAGRDRKRRQACAVARDVLAIAKAGLLEGAVAGAPPKLISIRYKTRSSTAHSG
jgi:hypothetical protein